MTSATIIADSVSPEGVRLTTMQVTFHRFVLAEFNTHRVFSRNSASSRAIPFEKQVERLLEDPALPVEWPSEQKGMQGGEPLSPLAHEDAEDIWGEALEQVIGFAQELRRLPIRGKESRERLHKSVVNRLLEPWMWHTAVVTSTAWSNFFAQRCSPLAQPEIRVAAEAMNAAYEGSEPRELPEGAWHLPYTDTEDWEAARLLAIQEIGNLGKSLFPWMTKISAARCARVSYLTQDGSRDIEADLALYERLTSARPAHWSPLEHVATPWAENRQSEHALDFYAMDGVVHHVSTSHLPKVGNLLGWRSLRTEVETIQGEVTFR